jgi:hypothetical protein
MAVLFLRESTLLRPAHDEVNICLLTPINECIKK